MIAVVPEDEKRAFIRAAISSAVIDLLTSCAVKLMTRVGRTVGTGTTLEREWETAIDSEREGVRESEKVRVPLSVDDEENVPEVEFSGLTLAVTDVELVSLAVLEGAVIVTDKLVLDSEKVEDAVSVTLAESETDTDGDADNEPVELGECETVVVGEKLSVSVPLLRVAEFETVGLPDSEKEPEGVSSCDPVGGGFPDVVSNSDADDDRESEEVGDPDKDEDGLSVCEGEPEADKDSLGVGV
jgi:hypothetical protein